MLKSKLLPVTLDFPFFSDADHGVADVHGAWRDKMMYGKKIHLLPVLFFSLAKMGTLWKPDAR
jgi:peroxiredoxin